MEGALHSWTYGGGNRLKEVHSSGVMNNGASLFLKVKVEDSHATSPQSILQFLQRPMVQGPAVCLLPPKVTKSSPAKLGDTAGSCWWRVGGASRAGPPGTGGIR
jgi:hypothetical protein